MVKTKRKTATKKHHQLHDDHNFILIAGGGFLVIFLMFMITGGDMLIGARRGHKIQASEQKMVEKYVSIEDSVVTPETLTIKRGTTVTWTNKDIKTHTIAADDGSFNTGNLHQDESGSVTFDTAGTFDYKDSSNPQLSGTIIVE